jgi:Spy/CpxP family protein refolding chaperone
MVHFFRTACLTFLASTLVLTLLGCGPTTSSSGKMGGKMDDKMGGKMDDKMGGKMDDKK